MNQAKKLALSFYKNQKKGAFSIGDIPAFAKILGISAVIGVVMLLIVADLKTQTVTNTAGCNSTTTAGCGYDYNTASKAEEGIYKVFTWFVTIGLVAGAVIIIGFLSGAFGNK